MAVQSRRISLKFVESRESRHVAGASPRPLQLVFDKPAEPAKPLAVASQQRATGTREASANSEQVDVQVSHDHIHAHLPISISISISIVITVSMSMSIPMTMRAGGCAGGGGWRRWLLLLPSDPQEVMS